MQDCTVDGVPSLKKYQDALLIADDCLKQLSDLVGYTDAKPLAVEPNWNHKFVLSGMYANGRNVFRITPDDQAVTLEEFLVKDAKDPTFRIGDETITFPGGKIIEDAKIVDIGTYGYWVETAKDVMPVLTRVDDYFRNNPSYQETFNTYEVGTEYTFNNIRYESTWEPKKNGTGSAVVIADPANADNKVLEIKGNYTLKNLKLTKNVIAGDTYAEHQAWEVTVTLPADVAEDDELQLLYVINEKKKTSDQGIKIAGTKVYYDKDGAFVELEGVTLTAGGKYTIIREMNFATEGAYTCDYYIYDARGKEVGSVKKVPVPATMELPAHSINMVVKNASGAAVLLDDYKLYPTKVNSDFCLYDGKTGMKITDIQQAQEGDVGYRFAYLNSTGTEKSYTVMAAYYDGENKVSEEVLHEVKIAPYGDGVLSGLAENKQEGKQMLVYLKDNNPAEDDAPATGDGEPAGDKTGLDTQMLIIIGAAAAVVVIAIVVIVIVASSKKKKKAAAATEESVVEADEETTEE